MIAVLTGDIVNSTKMSNQLYQATLEKLKDLLQQVNTQLQASGDIYRGDEFQIQYPDPLSAIKSALSIKLSLYLSSTTQRPIQSTLSLAYGDYEILAEKPNTSSGAVFIKSGRELANTAKGNLSLNFSSSENTTNHIDPEIKLLTDFLNHQLNKLTHSQAVLLYQYLETDFAEHKILAAITQTSRQNISARLNSMGAYLVRDYIKLINKKVAQRTSLNSLS